MSIAVEVDFKLIENLRRGPEMSITPSDVNDDDVGAFTTAADADDDVTLATTVADAGAISTSLARARACSNLYTLTNRRSPCNCLRAISCSSCHRAISFDHVPPV